MLIETQYLTRTKKLLVSFINAEGKTELKYFDWEHPFKYQICSPNDPDIDPKYKSWDGKHIKKIFNVYPDRYATYEFLDALPKEETKEIFEFYLPNIYFIDIETEIVDGFPDPADAATMIQSISIVYDDQIVLLGLKDMTEEVRARIESNTNKYFEKFEVDYKLKYVKYDCEFDMLKDFFDKAKKMPCITGWNFLDFDFRFLVNRAKKLSKEYKGNTYYIDPASCSYTRRLNKIFRTEYEIPAHKLVYDYMLLYDSLDTSVKVKESKSLDFVSDALLGVKKIDFKGSLSKLYEDDFETFMYYNAVDSVLVQQIHNKGKYIDIIFAIASLSKIRAVDVYSYANGALGSLAVTEGVLREMFREDENILLVPRPQEEKERTYPRIAGGWVKDPAVGMNSWVACYDFASLYPTTQRQFYIAPENYKGIRVKDDPEYYLCNKTQRKLKIDESDVICSNGCVFRKKKSPTLKMLENVYSERKEKKKIMQVKKLERDELKKELEELKNSM